MGSRPVLFKKHQPVLFDGGMATELYERGFYINRPFEELNLTNPGDVAAVHKAYIEAGAQFITTNTFSIPSQQLGKFDIAGRQAEILEAALRIAGEAATIRSGVKIALTIGPTGALIEPLGPMALDEVRAEYATIAGAARTAREQKGLRFDTYILETFSEPRELDAAIDGIRSVDSGQPIVASMTVSSHQSERLAEFASRFGADPRIQAVGLNCSDGPNDLLKSVQVVAAKIELPLIVQPNSGLPRQINGRYFYMTSPDYLAKYARRFLDAGADGVGGCCGTGPLHIEAIARSLSMLTARSHAQPPAQLQTQIEVAEPQDATDPGAHAAAVRAGKSLPRTQSVVLSILARGEKVRSVELMAPKGTDLEGFAAAVRRVEAAGIPLVNVPDGARASTRVGSLHLASWWNRQESRTRVLPHFTPRDRNLIALQADLLGASINGVDDVLLITGDPPKLGNNKNATAVYDIDSIGLSFLVHCLNTGTTAGGEELGSRTGFSIGVAANPTAPNLELELSRWKYKVQSGADYAVTQPIFDPETFLRWREKLGEFYRPHVIGIWPFLSLRNAEFMANEVPGVHVPQWAIDKMARHAGNAEDSRKMGIEIARTVMQKLESSCEGFAVSAPLGKVEIALEVLS
jgi:methionine synthase I (cobalamin-dependent)/5,10-methylenetetrahydrofolate reductase